MSRGNRYFLPVLLCLLVISWGTCPCILARAVGSEDAGSQEDAETIVCDCCDRGGQSDSDGAPSPDPDERPCCGRAGSLHDLPRPGGEGLELPAEAPFLATPVIEAAVLASRDRVPERDDPGPPRGNALHACPVGIVLILS